MGKAIICVTRDGLCCFSFYLDPSHRRPVHPYLLKYLTEKAGFEQVEMYFSESSRMPFTIPGINEEDEKYKDFNEAMQQLTNLLYGPQDYAIIARR